MSNTRTPQENQQELLNTQNKKMARRKFDPECRQSRLNDDVFLKTDKALVHITGNNTTRTIFIETLDKKHKRSFTRLNFSSNKFTEENLDLATAREEYRKMGFHYFSYSKSITKVTAFTKKLIKCRIFQEELDSTINQAIAKLCESKKDIDLSLFDPENATQISSAKTEYDFWLKKWLKPLTDDFSEVEDEDARRLLQLLKSYLAGGFLARTFWHLHAKRHHCVAINKVIEPYENMVLLQTFSSVTQVFMNRKGVRPNIITEETNSDDDDIISLDADDNEIRPFIPLKKSLYGATVKSILKDLETEINASDDKLIKPHGALCALFEVLKDHNGADYFNQKKKSDNGLLHESANFVSSTIYGRDA